MNIDFNSMKIRILEYFNSVNERKVINFSINFRLINYTKSFS